MSELREQSQPQPEWFDAPDVIMGAELGQYRLVITTPDHVEDDEGVYHASEGTLHLTDLVTDEVLLERPVTPVLGPEFTTWDEQSWYVIAEDELVMHGVDVDALKAAARQDDAA